MLHLNLNIQTAFPGLTATNYSLTSPIDVDYNCIAWAAGENDVWWWPDAMFTRYWPDETPRLETVDAFVQAFSTKGYVPCDDGHPEQGFEKVALYGLKGKPTHAARQLSDGNWTSKLGEHCDVSHTINALDGPEYGSVAMFLKRAI